VWKNAPEAEIHRKIRKIRRVFFCIVTVVDGRKAA
jgi:hypothetical protein